MGRAIVRDPQVFLFDEPLSNLDAKLRVQMRGEIKELHQRLKTTTIYVTHDQVEAMTMADKIVVMRDGVIEQMGTPLDLYDRPQNIFVAGFIGSPSMNFIPGKMDGNTFVTDDGIRLPVVKGDPRRGDLWHPARAPPPRPSQRHPARSRGAGADGIGDPGAGPPRHRSPSTASSASASRPRRATRSRCRRISR